MATPSPGPKEHHYPAVGRCIYCGCLDQALLTDEHIFPFSLGGTLVLDKSSCLSCNDVTKKYEQTVARDIFGRFRIRHGIQTRNPKKRPKHLTIGTLSADGVEGFAQVPAQLYPAPLFLYKMSPAGIGYGAPETLDTFAWVPYNAWSGDLNEFKKEFNWDGKLTIRPVPVEFARTLAKIAYSYAVGEFGIYAFKPIGIGIILSKNDNVGYLVGGRYIRPTGSVDDLELPQPGTGHTRLFYCLQKSRGSRTPRG